MADPMDIVPYDPTLLHAFQRLNRAWISRYFRMEAEDERELEQAEALIIDTGGQIFFAFEHGAEHIADNVLGCVGVFIREPDFYEIIKLAVDDNAQGRGIGRKLMQQALDFIAQSGATRAIILSSRSLSPAMGLYTAMGFSEVELGYKHLFDRCDIELVCPVGADT